MYDKFILNLTDDEILREVSEYFNHKVVYPKDKIGWITEHPEVYTKDGNTINVEALNGLYNSKEYLDKYIIVSSITSLRRRPADLFTLIRSQKRGNRVLEFGCGSSTHGIACAQLGCEVTIVDISNGMLNWAKRRYNKRGLKVTVHPVATPLPPKYFDTVICSDVFEHLPNPARVLKQFITAMKPKSTVHLHVATTVNLQKGHLPVAVNNWNKVCLPILKKLFVQKSKHNWMLKG